ncbi:MAG: T9SS type A sorting domain-containing protein [Candidatus Cloacimonetes bacterium]|nr:T9SS type A sorting domain-containing protein [Candidatus Cloacimonadota bacterium]
MKKIILSFTFYLLIFSFCLLTFSFSFAEIPREYFHKKCDAFGKIPSRADSVHSYDALSYEINLQLFPETEYISGNVLAKIQAKEDNLTEIVYELEQLNVDSIFVNGNSAQFSYDNQIITITLDQSYNTGDTLSTQVFYQGEPTLSSDVYHTGIHWGNYIYTYSDPNGARFWWPCYDHPWDKTTTEMNLTVPEEMLVASNGILENEIDNGDGTKTFCWNNTDQIATYLVSICAGNYATFEQDYEDIPIINYVYPGHLGLAQNDFACIPTAMGVYENLYGDYPFQKYGMAECGVFGGWGGMEHQTMTSIGSALIDGQATYDWIFVHELAHQWFGDCLTPLTWADVWLSEGFAVYSEALYVEATQGFDAMCDYVATSFHQYYLNWAGGNSYTTYDPPYNMYFTPATYEKPASVLHMIRLMVGDSTFFNILQTYFDTYKYGNVVTTDFIDVCESVSGMDLQEFFNDWIFGSGVPSLEYYYIYDPNTIMCPGLYIIMRSISNTDTEFEMQVPFLIEDASGTYPILADVEPVFTQNDVFVSHPLESIIFDPDNWILHRGCTKILPVLTSTLPGDNFVWLCWEEFSDTLPDSYYSIYRSEISGSGYEKITEVPSDETSFVDTTVFNGNTYYYVITYGVHWVSIEGGYNGETEFSNELFATPMAFPMDSGILLVDETRDGSGGPIDPYDATVDSFYNEVLENFQITQYDYETEGAPDLSLLANYSTIIWYDDDFNQHLIEDEIENLASLVISGGNLLISGWKTADYIPESFMRTFLNTGNTILINEPDFLGALGEDDYPYIDVNGDFVPAWNDRWTYVATFEDTPLENVLYRYDSFSGDNADKPVGIVNALDDKNVVVLGFPLYFMQGDDVKAFFERILSDFGEGMGVDDNSRYQIPDTRLSNCPNPFTTSTTISFNLATRLRSASPGQAEIKIYNIKGQRIRKLKSENVKCKINEVVWNGKDEKGKQLPSGIYFYKLNIKNSPVKKMILLR